MKHILSKYGPMEIESPLAQAISADQAVQLREGEYSYLDAANRKASLDLDKIGQEKERGRVLSHIEDAKTIEELKMVHHLVNDYDVSDEYDNRFLTLENEQQDGK
jgi:hypothetical protein